MSRPIGSSEKEVPLRKTWASSALSNPISNNNVSEKVFRVSIKHLSHVVPRLTTTSSGVDQYWFRRQPVSRKPWAEAHPKKSRAITSRPVSAPLPEPLVQTLERYQGTVDRIIGDYVELTLEDPRGELSAAKLSVAQMTEFGLSLTEDFDCTVTQQGPEVKVKFTPTPRRPLTPEASAKLRAEIDSAYQDFDDDF